MIERHQILQILDDASASGQGPLVHFTREEDACEQFVQIVLEIAGKIEDADKDVLAQDGLARLTEKVAAYCVKRGWQSVAMVDNLRSMIPTMIDTVSESPEIVRDINITLSAAIDRHTMRAAQAASKLRVERQKGDVVPSAILEAIDGYSLVELLTPSHLQEESSHLGHCVGTLHNIKALEAKNLTKENEDAKYYLHYAIKMRKGISRIFSLRAPDGKPCVTIEYNCKTHEIEQIQGNPPLVTGKEIFFPALCDALYKLREQIPVTAFLSLLGANEENYVLIRQGRFIPGQGASANDILCGQAHITKETSQKRLMALSQVPGLILNIADPETLARLPEYVKGHIWTNSKIVKMPKLKTAGSITAPEATLFEAPCLERAGDISIKSVTTVSLDALKKAGQINIPKAVDLSIPLLEECYFLNADSLSEFKAPRLRVVFDDIAVDGAQFFSAPKLERVKNINAKKSLSFDAQRLKSAKRIQIPYASIVKLPFLEKVENLNATRATIFEVPRLRKAEFIRTDFPGQLDLFSLEEAGDIIAEKTTFFNAPKLKSVTLVKANAALCCDVSSLEKASNLHFENVKTWHAPLLKSAETLFVFYATTVFMPLLETVGDFTAASTTTLHAPKLTKAGHLSLREVRNPYLPLLETANCMSMESAVIFVVPALKRALDIYIDAALEIGIPKLEAMGALFGPSLPYFFAHNLKSATNIFMPKARYFAAPFLEEEPKLTTLHSSAIRHTPLLLAAVAA